MIYQEKSEFCHREFFIIQKTIYSSMLRHGLYLVQTPRKDKTVFDLKQRCFYPRENQKLTANQVCYPLTRLGIFMMVT